MKKLIENQALINLNQAILKLAEKLIYDMEKSEHTEKAFKMLMEVIHANEREIEKNNNIMDTQKIAKEVEKECWVNYEVVWEGLNEVYYSEAKSPEEARARAINYWSENLKLDAMDAELFVIEA